MKPGYLISDRASEIVSSACRQSRLAKSETRFRSTDRSAFYRADDAYREHRSFDRERTGSPTMSANAAMVRPTFRLIGFSPSASANDCERMTARFGDAGRTRNRAADMCEHNRRKSRGLQLVLCTPRSKESPWPENCLGACTSLPGLFGLDYSNGLSRSILSPCFP